MPPATKTLSPAELAKLEHAFATDPVSEAYKPLAEAYLGMGRFMEAMVVCKKGVKAHPARPDPRVLLARVYAEQGKDKKAMEELTGALQVAPSDKIALRLMGSLQVKTGEGDAGKANLLKAFEADPKDDETTDLMQKHGVPVPKPVVVEPPPPPPPPSAPPAPVAVRAPVAPSPAPEPHESDPDVAAPVAPPRKKSPTQPPVKAQPSSPGRPAQPRSAVRAPVREEEDEAQSEANEVPRRRERSGASKALFFLLIFAVPVGAAAYYGYGQYKAKLIKDANKQLREATDKIKSDTFAAYKDAVTLSENALGLDGSADTNRNARGLLAYSYTVRWGEHQHDETNREGAEKNIKAGLEAKEATSYLYAADAMFDYYNGKGAEALKKIDERIRVSEAEHKQYALYYLTRGILQMNTGDLEDSRESLEKAQAIAPDDARVFVALGTLNRRRGADMQALQSFGNALKYTRNSHPDALLGTANLVLDTPEPGRGYVNMAKYVKALLEMEPPPSPRQLAQAHFVRALLVSRVAADLPGYSGDIRKALEEGTGVTVDDSKVQKEIQKEENEGLALDRNNPELLSVRARRLSWEKKYDEAAEELRKAIKANPSAAHYHVELAKVQMRKEGGEAQAEETLKTALSMVQNSPKLLSLLGQVQYRLKKYGEATATLEKATGDEKQKNPEARYVLGRIYRDGDKKDLDKAIKLFDKAGAEYFADPTQAAMAYDDLAQTYELRAKDGDKDKARVNYEKSMTADKEYAPAYCHYAKYLAKAADPKDLDKRKAMAAEGIKLDPQGACAADLARLKEG